MNQYDLEEPPSDIERAARTAFGERVGAIRVEICRGRDPDGMEVWQQAGAILVDKGPARSRESFHGAFLYREDYDGPPLSPQLDPARQKLWPLERGSNTNVRSQSDMHAVFVQSLPDEWGTRALEAHIPAYAAADASERLAILSGMQSCRVGALRFNYGDASLEQSVVGLEALDTMNSSVNRFLSGAAKKFLKEVDYWSIYSNGGAQPKVSFKFSKADPDEWIAKFSLQPFGAYDQPRVERACMMMAEKAKIETPANSLIISEASGRTLFLSKRYDRYEGSPLHRLNAAVALDRSGKYEYAEYSELADAVEKLSRNPEADSDQLFRRMLMNAYCNNTDDHLGQWEFVQQPNGGYRLAPAYDIQIDDHADQRGHMMRFAGGSGVPEYSVSWIESQADAMGVPRKEALEAARDVLQAVTSAPIVFQRVQLSMGDVARVTPALRLDEARQLQEGVKQQLEMEEPAADSGRRLRR